MQEAFAAIERIIGQDPAGRNIGGLILSGEVERAARSLLTARRVGIVSGFFVPAVGAGETDGPPGAVALGWALVALGVPCDFLTDQHNAPLFQALGAEPLFLHGAETPPAPTHLVAVERPGRAADGRYYNMRGEDISAHTPSLDGLFLAAAGRGIVTIAIGDGGNEIGMGRIREQVVREVAWGPRIASVVPADHLIVCGVSNWGAYGLVAALGLLCGRNLLPQAATVREQIEKMVQIGAVDGNTRRREPTVDGLALPDFLAVLQQLPLPVT